MFFEDRIDAGKKLAEIFVSSGRDFSGWGVIGLARGGVIVASQVAEKLGLPLQAFCVEDFETETNIIVITSLATGTFFHKKKNLRGKFVPDVSKLKHKELPKFMGELLEKETLYNNSSFFKVENKQIILCDDGIVSGRSVFAAIYALRYYGVKEIVLGIPVVPPWLTNQKNSFDIITWRVTKLKEYQTGKFYYSFDDTPDEEVSEAIRNSKKVSVY